MSDAVEGVVQIGFAPTLVKYMSVVSLTLLICDYLYTLELEISLVWPKKWNITKIVFLYARYSPFIDVPMVFLFYFNASRSLEFFTQVCPRIDRANIWLISFGILSTEGILVIRTHGLMGGTRKFLIYLITQCVVLCLAVIAILGVSSRSWTYIPPPIWSHGCRLGWTPPHGRLIFLAIVALLTHEIIVMLITLYIGWTKYRHQQQTPLIRILYRDGTLYFILIFLISLAGIINIRVNSQENTGLFSVFQRVMHSILSTRIILQARKAASDTEDQPIEGLQLSNFNFLTTEGSESTKSATSFTSNGGVESRDESVAVIAPSSSSRENV